MIASISEKILKMVGNSYNKSVVREVECHRSINSRNGFTNLEGLVFYLKLITELIFEEDANVLGAHVPDSGLSFDGKVFGRVKPEINHFKAWTNAHIWLQAPKGDFFIFKEAIAG